jgi:hypothetical protein
MLATWRRCKQKFTWSYLDDLTVKTPSMGLARGSAGHKALEAYYGGSRDLVEALGVAWETFLDKCGNEPEQKEWDLLESALKRYDEWASVNDKFEILRLEYHFVIDVGPYKMQGYIDGIVMQSGNVWLLEHKFQKRVSTKHIPLDPQVSIYMIAAIIAGYQPSGVMYNMVRIGNGPTAIREPVVRKLAYRNPEGLQYFGGELLTQMQEVNDFIENEQTPYRNLTSDCTWDCPFQDACLDLMADGNASATLALFDKKEF